MTHTANACPTQRQIIVGNTCILIQFDYELDDSDKATETLKRINGEYNKQYSIHIEHKFGKSSFKDGYDVTANNIEDVVEYFRNLYRGLDKPWEGLVHIVPYSWE